MKEIIKIWKSLDFNSKPYLHSKDSILKESYYNDYKDFKHYIQDPNFGLPNKKFHLNLLPVPYIGNIIDAKVYILALNPGFKILDYYAETYDKSVRDVMIKNIKQELNKDSFPFFKLNPEFLWLGGGRYWENKLKDIISEVQRSRKKTYVDALKFVSKKIAVLELVPYHSKEFTLSQVNIKKLFTPKVMIDFVKNYVIPRANEGKACIIVTRKSNLWGLSEERKRKNIIVYLGPESRSAHLSMNSRGGKMIVEFLLQTNEIGA